MNLFLSPHRAMQELLVHFQPEPSVPPPTPSTLSSLTTVAGQSGESVASLQRIHTGTCTYADCGSVHFLGRKKCLW